MLFFMLLDGWNDVPKLNAIDEHLDSYVDTLDAFRELLLLLINSDGWASSLSFSQFLAVEIKQHTRIISHKYQKTMRSFNFD